MNRPAPSSSSSSSSSVPCAVAPNTITMSLFSIIHLYTNMLTRFVAVRDLQVHKKLASSASKGDVYETELLDQFSDTDAARDFFSRLDLQLNKVNQFYKNKEKEFLERGESSKKQMEILLELKAAPKQQRDKSSTVPSQDSREDPSISCSITCEDETGKDAGEQEQLQDSSICEFGGKNEAEMSESPRTDEEGRLMRMKKEESKMRSLSGKVINCQGKNLRINIPLTTPSRTLSAITYLVWEDFVNQSKKCGPEGGKLNINKTKIHHAEKMIRGAFVELYKGLGFLKSYR